MNINDIKIEPSQVAVLVWTYRTDGYNVAGVFRPPQLAYKHAMTFINPDLSKDVLPITDDDFTGFCIETRHVLQDTEENTIGNSEEDFFAHEEYYFDKKGEYIHTIHNSCWNYDDGKFTYDWMED